MYIFIADIHMRPGNAQDEDKFLGWLDKFGKAASKIYILGDLFNYWYSGMEDNVARVLTALDKDKISIIPGNRDFLMHSSGLAQVEKTEEVVLDIYGRKILAAHGHTLTVHDRGFRVLHALGWPLLKYLDGHLDIKTKEKIAGRLVSASSLIRPLNSEIKPGISSEKGVDTIICGHLHRGIMREDLIVLPPFATEKAWLEIDENSAVFKRIAKPDS